MNDFIDFEFEAKQHKAAAERVGRAAAEFRKMVHEDEDRRRKDRSERIGRESRAQSEEEIRREYAALGLLPPSETLVSIAFLLRSGWTIAYPNGAAVLVQPQWVAPQPRRDGDGQQT